MYVCMYVCILCPLESAYTSVGTSMCINIYSETKHIHIQRKQIHIHIYLFQVAHEGECRDFGPYLSIHAQRILHMYENTLTHIFSVRCRAGVP